MRSLHRNYSIKVSNFAVIGLLFNRPLCSSLQFSSLWRTDLHNVRASYPTAFRCQLQADILPGQMDAMQEGVGLGEAAGEFAIRPGLKVAVVGHRPLLAAEQLARLLGTGFAQVPEQGGQVALEAVAGLDGKDSGLVVGGLKPSMEMLESWSDLLEQMDFVLHLKNAEQSCSEGKGDVDALLEEQYGNALLEVDASSGNIEEALDLALTLIECASENNDRTNEDEEISTGNTLLPADQEVVLAGKEKKKKSKDPEKERQRLLSLEGALKKKEKKGSGGAAKRDGKGDGRPTDETEGTPFYLRFQEKDKQAPKEETPVIPSQLEAVLEDPEDETPDEDLQFGPFVLKKHLARALRRADILTPTPIQQAAMGPILEGENVLVHSETGSGKTLSYLLPLLRDLNWATPQQIMVVTPSRELAVQVAREAAALMAGRTNLIKLVVDDSFSGEKKGHPALRTERPVIVGTARQLQKAIDSDRKRAAAMMKNLKTVVLDEVDRLLDPLTKYATPKQIRQRKRHPKAAAAILKEVYETKPDAQFVGCSATVGRKLRREVLLLMGGSDVSSLSEGPKLIRTNEAAGKSEDRLRAVEIPDSIEHWYVPLVEDQLEERLNALMVTVLACKPRAPLVFIPREAKITEVVQGLRDMGLAEAVALHEAMGFGEAKPGTNAILTFDRLTSLFKKQTDEERPPLIVTSEDTARGLHFEQVDYVFLLKKPKSPDEYLHLAGRTGRQGKKGTVVSIVSYREAKSVEAWEKQLGIQLTKKDFL